MLLVQRASRPDSVGINAGVAGGGRLARPLPPRGPPAVECCSVSQSILMGVPESQRGSEEEGSMREEGRERGGREGGRGRGRREGRRAHSTAPLHAPRGSVDCRARPSAQILLAPKVLLVQHLPHPPRSSLSLDPCYQQVSHLLHPSHISRDPQTPFRLQPSGAHACTCSQGTLSSSAGVRQPPERL